MGKKYENVLAQYAVEQKKRLLKYKDSILYASEVHNYKDPRYSVDKIAKELLRLTPSGHRDFRLLERVTNRNMNRVKYDTIYRRYTKPHKNRRLRTAIQRELSKHESKSRANKRHKLNEIKMMIKENEIELLGIGFEIELINTVYETKTPKTDKPYKQKIAAHVQLIQEYEARGEKALADEIKSKPPVREPVFKEIAESIKKKYLSTTLSKRDVKRELTLRTREVKVFAYPTPEDMCPKE